MSLSQLWRRTPLSLSCLDWNKTNPSISSESFLSHRKTQPSLGMQRRARALHKNSVRRKEEGVRLLTQKNLRSRDRLHGRSLSRPPSPVVAITQELCIILPPPYLHILLSDQFPKQCSFSWPFCCFVSFWAWWLFSLLSPYFILSANVLRVGFVGEELFPTWNASRHPVICGGEGCTPIPCCL